MMLLQPCKHCPDLWGEEDNNGVFQRQILDVRGICFSPVPLYLNNQNRDKIKKMGLKYSRPSGKGQDFCITIRGVKRR